MAIIRLGVKLRILDIIVNVFYNVLHGGQVVAHIGYFDVGNSSARGNLLELAFKREFGECVDMLAHVHMITVCIVAKKPSAKGTFPAALADTSAKISGTSARPKKLRRACCTCKSLQKFGARPKSVILGGLERVAAQKREALYVVGGKPFYYFFFDILRKRLAVAKRG